MMNWNYHLIVRAVREIMFTERTKVPNFAQK